MNNFISKEALLIHKVLLKKGIENPLINSIKKNNSKNTEILIIKYIKKIMTLLNLDLNNSSISDTPKRIFDLYTNEIFFGLNYMNFPKINFIKNKMQITEGTVNIRKISLTSICEHHFLIIDGKATVSYIPKEKIIGLSKINEITIFFASRPQLQERLTQQILVSLQTLLKTKNVAVSIEAIHYCIKSRGIKDNNSIVTTTLLDGLFKTNKIIGKEFLLLASKSNLTF